MDKEKLMKTIELRKIVLLKDGILSEAWKNYEKERQEYNNLLASQNIEGDTRKQKIKRFNKKNKPLISYTQEPVYEIRTIQIIIGGKVDSYDDGMLKKACELAFATYKHPGKVSVCLKKDVYVSLPIISINIKEE